MNAETAFPMWIVLGPLFAAVIVYLVIVRRFEARRIERTFPRDRILLSSFGVNFYGLRSEPGGPARSAGALVLTKEVLYYRARFSKREVRIPIDSITTIDVIEGFKGRPLYTKAIQFRFERGEHEEAAAFRIPYPDRWIVATRGSLQLRGRGGREE